MGESQDGPEQGDVVAFLSDPQSYPSAPEQVERFETHGALVFIAGDEAWKIKRAARFSYMDFSTLEKRKAACEREVSINRRLAPDIYLGCVPISLTAEGRLAFNGPGEPVEWAVHMRRFDQDALLSRLAETGTIPLDLATGIADVILDSHRGAPPATVGQGAQRIQKIAENVCRSVAAQHRIFSGTAVGDLRQRMHMQMSRATAILDERATRGYVRRCHGDLHLANIVLWQGRPTLFDAIEFDDELATIDTLYDLAFVLMDLDNRGHRGAANIILNRYLWRCGADLDIDGVRAMPLFFGLRAAIRAMVMADRALLANDVKEDDAPTARGYLDAAIEYLTPAAPQLIAVGGLSGTGKSTLARTLAPWLEPAPGAVHLRSDVERKRLHGVAETVRLAPETYTQAASDATYAALYAEARRVLSAGHAVIVDAVFARPEERAGIAAVAGEQGLPFRGLWLEAPTDVLVDRVAHRGGDASDATADVVRQQSTRNIGELSEAWIRIDARGDAGETARQARGAIVGSVSISGPPSPD